jgi:hypothetical protein
VDTLSPEFLPLFAFLFAGLALAIVAIHRLADRQWRSALRLGAASVLLVALVILGGRYAAWKQSQAWRLPESMRPRPLVPASPFRPAEQQSEAQDTMTLVLGGVRLLVPASNQYRLSVTNETFLTLDTSRSGVLVTCDVAGSQTFPVRTSMVAAQIRQNSVVYRAGGIRATRRDPHTILVEDGDVELLRVHHADPRTIEIAGRFLPPGSDQSSVVILADGLIWPGNMIPPGPVDLTQQGAGRIDLEPSGAIRIQPN